MIHVEFTARCGDESIPLTISLDYQPGKQMHRARRIAAGHLLAALEPSDASIRSVDDELVTVTIGEKIWVIGEGRAGRDGRGRV